MDCRFQPNINSRIYEEVYTQQPQKLNVWYFWGPGKCKHFYPSS